MAEKKVLIIDDEELVLELFKSFFSEEELSKIDFCYKGDEAAEQLKENSYERVIIDYNCCDSSAHDSCMLNAKNNGVDDRIMITSISDKKKLSKNLATVGIRKPITSSKMHQLCFGNLDSVKSIFV
jgi:DNA-binding response OmpR family regulator